MGGNYNTNEVEIGTWIDGRKRYRKIIQHSGTQEANKTYSINVDTGLNINNIDITTILFHVNLKAGAAVYPNNSYEFSKGCGLYAPSNSNLYITGEAKIFSINVNVPITITAQIEYCKKS